MKKFRCTVCGYVHADETAPDSCPVCKAPASVFVEVERSHKKFLGGKNSNAYIVFYATVMVVIVAALLAVAALALQPRQAANVVVEKKSAILGAIGRGTEADEVKDKTKYINDEYAEYIVDSYAVNGAGERVDDTDAFALLANLKAEYEKPADSRLLPVFVGRDAEGKTLYVLPVWGAGLWGPIWGYVALEEDWDTIAGVVFDHKGETPGLGAEIATPDFEDQFVGKTVFEGDELISIAVVKGGAPGDDPHGVDAVSGGTITSRGVETMLRDCLSDYEPYLRSRRAAIAEQTANTQTVTDKNLQNHE